jgi:prevent-host-death family protein
MKLLTIRDLHIQTGHWVRKAQRSGVPLVITDRGRPVAALTAYDASKRPRGLPKRSALKQRLPRIRVDSAATVSDMRERS